MRRMLAVAVLLLAVLGFALLRAGKPPPPQVELRERNWPVAVEAVEVQSLRPTLTLYGRIEAPDRVRASAPVSGRVLEVLVRDGERVAAGAVLARLDPRDLLPPLEQARAEVERESLRQRHDRAALQQERELLRLAQAKVERFEKLRSARLGAEITVDQAREEVARAQLAVTVREQALAEHPARLAQAQARLDEAARDAERGEIVAPFSARIGPVEVAAGDPVQTGQTVLTLYPSDALFLRAKVPAGYVAELRAALEVGERLLAWLDFGGAQVSAWLERIAGEADARGVDVLLRLEDSAAVPVGAFSSATLARPEQAELVSLPFSALHRGDRIYRVEDGRLRGLRVQRVGEHRVADEPRVLVRAPELGEGTPVMVTHLPNALDGLGVEIVER